MESIRELFRIGYGPSSSHTMGPRFASSHFYNQYSMAAYFHAHLFGSLAATGKGHLTDIALEDVFEDYSFLFAILPPGAFVGMGLLIALKNIIDGKLKDRAERHKADEPKPVENRRVRVTG